MPHDLICAPCGKKIDLKADNGKQFVAWAIASSAEEFTYGMEGTHRFLSVPDDWPVLKPEDIVCDPCLALTKHEVVLDVQCSRCNRRFQSVFAGNKTQAYGCAADVIYYERHKCNGVMAFYGSCYDEDFMPFLGEMPAGVELKQTVCDSCIKKWIEQKTLQPPAPYQHGTLIPLPSQAPPSSDV